MSGEELNRKYWELCGWRAEHNPMQRPRGFHGLPEWWVDEPNGHTAPRLPALHLDANLAIAEADKVLWNWWVLHRQGNHFVCRVVEVKSFGRIYTNQREEGETACEAILKALIAAKEASLTPAKRKAEK